MDGKSIKPTGEVSIKTKGIEIKESFLLPATAQDVITSTISPGDGILSKLQNQFSWIGVEDLHDRDKGIDPELRRTVASHIQEFIMELEERIRRYLIQEVEQDGKTVSSPTPYAELLAHTLRNPSAATPTTKRGLAELSFTAIAEITPILRDLSIYIHEHVTPLLPAMQSIQALDSPSGLLNFLKVANVQANDTYTFFGALDYLGSRIAGFPRLDLKEKKFSNRLVVQDPLATEATSYWREKRRFYQQNYVIDMPRPTLVAARSVSAYNAVVEQQAIWLEKEILEFRKKAEEIKTAPPQDQTEDQRQEEISVLQAQIKQTQTLQAHYYTLGTWIAVRAEAMQGISEARLSDHASSLTFAWGDAEEIFSVLNALEAVKHHNPELYARLLGIRAGATSRDAVKSDLYGNVLHIAFARTLHQATTSDRAESAALRARMEALQTLDIQSTPLVYVSEKQWEFLEKTLEPQEEGEAKEKGDMAARALMMVGISPESYLLRKMFQSPDVVEREKVIAQLRTATPEEFLRLLKQITKKKGEVPKDIAEVINERFKLDHETWWEFKGVEYTYPSPPYFPKQFVFFLHSNSLDKLIIARNLPTPFVSRESGRDVIMRELWRTTPSERLLEGEEWWRFLEGRIKAIKQLSRGATLKDIALLLTAESMRSEVGAKGLADMVGEQTESRLLKEEANKELIVRGLLAILDAHPDITQEQWIEWWKKISTKEKIEVNNDRLPGPAGRIGRTTRISLITDEARVTTMYSFLEQLTPEQVLQRKSHFFVLIPQVMVRNVDWDEPEDYKNEVTLGNEQKLLTLFFPAIKGDNTTIQALTKNAFHKYPLYLKLFLPETFIKRYKETIVDLQSDLYEWFDKIFIDLSSDSERARMAASLFVGIAYRLDRGFSGNTFGLEDLQDLTNLTALLNAVETYAGGQKDYIDFKRNFKNDYGERRMFFLYDSRSERPAKRLFVLRKTPTRWIVEREKDEHNMEEVELV